MNPDSIPPALAQELAGLEAAVKSGEAAGLAGVGGVIGTLTGLVLRSTDLVNPGLLDKALLTTAAVTALALVDGGVQMWRVNRKRGRIRPLAVQAIADEGGRLKAAFLASPLHQPKIQASSKRIAELATATQGFFDQPHESWLLAIGAIDQAHQAFIDSIIRQAEIPENR